MFSNRLSHYLQYTYTNLVSVALCYYLFLKNEKRLRPTRTSPAPSRGRGRTIHFSPASRRPRQRIDDYEKFQINMILILPASVRVQLLVLNASIQDFNANLLVMHITVLWHCVRSTVQRKAAARSERA